jgi:hypothetical protein
MLHFWSAACPKLQRRHMPTFSSDSRIAHLQQDPLRIETIRSPPFGLDTPKMCSKDGTAINGLQARGKGVFHANDS